MCLPVGWIFVPRIVAGSRHDVGVLPRLQCPDIDGADEAVTGSVSGHIS